MEQLLFLTWRLWPGNSFARAKNTNQDTCIILPNSNSKVLHLSVSSDGRSFFITPYLIIDQAIKNQIEKIWMQQIDPTHMRLEGAIGGATFQILDTQFKSMPNGELQEIDILKSEIDDWFSTETSVRGINTN